MTEIVWYGHSCVEIRSAGKRIWIDPFFTGNGDAPDHTKLAMPDLVLITHDHGDHLGDALDIAKRSSASFLGIFELTVWLGRQGIPQRRLLGGNIGGTLHFEGFDISMVPALHSSERGVPVGFVIRTPEGDVLYHAGDTGFFGDMRYIGEMYAPRVAFLPMDGRFCMDMKAAAMAAAAVGAKLVCPIHIHGMDTAPFRAELATRSPEARCIDMVPCVPFTA